MKTNFPIVAKYLNHHLWGVGGGGGVTPSLYERPMAWVFHFNIMSGNENNHYRKRLAKLVCHLSGKVFK